MRNGCLFCAIWDGEISSDEVMRADDILAIRDIHPQAPVHLLIIPREHIRSIAELREADTALVGRLLQQAKVVAEQAGIAEQGYRLIFNVRHHGGQEVDHLHLHLLGGKALRRLLP